MTSNPTQHLVVDGSNIATEGRTNPSLAQLDEAVSAVSKQGYGPVTVIVDATFPRRIDPSEVEEFERRTLEGTIVTPPAGVVGRGDAFILQVAAQVDAVVLSNDSFQEFHGEHEWLLNEDGRLLGGKPVPNVGWVFSPRGPVRGAKSRQSVREAKSSKSEKPTKTPTKTAAKKSAKKRKTTSPKQKNQTSSKEVSADSPMPVPKDPPASRRRRGAETRRDAQETGAKSSAPKPSAPKSSAPKSSAPKSNGVKAKKSAKSKESNHLNDVTEFMSFVSAHSLGDTIQGEVERFSSHGCYLRVATAQCYLPSKAMGDPPPTKARDVVSKGQLVEAKVESLDAERRGINVSLIRVLPRADRSDQQKPSSLPNGRSISNTPRRSESIMATPKKAAKKRTTKKAAVKKTVAKKTTAKKAAKKAPAKKAAAKKAPAKKAAPKKAAAKKAPAKKAAPKKAAAKKRTTKKAAKRTTKR
ncbi:MAG: S1 RNA-binding domain-containing protein [Acidimicrobiales bacterium]|nr:S1 RNA-binding domain-containing protein [Acidimicrobiales bacterium]